MRREAHLWRMQPHYTRGFGVSYQDEFATLAGTRPGAELIDPAVEVPQGEYRAIRPENRPTALRSRWVTGVFRRELPTRLVSEEGSEAKALFASLASGAFEWPEPREGVQPRHARVARVLLTDAPDGAVGEVALPAVTMRGARARYEVQSVPEHLEFGAGLAGVLLAEERELVGDLAQRYPRDVVVAQALPAAPAEPNVLTLLSHARITRRKGRELGRRDPHPDVAERLQPGVLALGGEAGQPSERTPVRLVRDQDGLAFVWTVADSAVRTASGPRANLLSFRLSAENARLEEARALADWTAWVAPEVAWLRQAGRTGVRAPWPLQALEELLLAGLGDIVLLRARLETVLLERNLVQPQW